MARNGTVDDGRRNLTDDQRAMQLSYLLEELKEQEVAAKAKKAAAAPSRESTGKFSRSRDTVSRERPDETKPKKKHNRSETAKKAGVPDRKARQAQVVRDKAPELAAKVAEGEMSLADACRTIKKQDIMDQDKVYPDLGRGDEIH